MNTEEREALLERYSSNFNQSEILTGLGAQIAFPSTELAHAILDPVLSWHRGGLGTRAVNGGILSALFDLAIGITGALHDPRRRSATVQLSTYFERPVLGDRVVVEARIERAGKVMLFSQAVIKDEEGVVCARCHGIVRVSERLWSESAGFLTEPNKTP